MFYIIFGVHQDICDIVHLLDKNYQLPALGTLHFLSSCYIHISIFPSCCMCCVCVVCVPKAVLGMLVRCSANCVLRAICCVVSTCRCGPVVALSDIWKLPGGGVPNVRAVVARALYR